MITSTENIIIVGGGSAGWMTAASIIRSFPNKNVIVIESPNVPTVGVGESTLGQFKRFCHFLKVDEIEMMRQTDASYKVGIQFNDFFQKNDGGFVFPFGKPFEDDTLIGMNIWLKKKAIYPETPIQDFVDCFFPVASLYKKNKYSLNQNNEFDNFNPLNDTAYHFDAIKFAVWLRDFYCKPRGVKHIQGTVVDIKTNENGIDKLILDSGDEFFADLFVDCTGFKSLLIGETLKQEFTTYNHILPNNRAWAAQVPYKDIRKEMQTLTNCTAIENGWVWNTPIWTRLGTGYVYSDKFVDPETAKEEFKRHLMSDKMVIPRTRDEVDSLNFKDVPMRIGVYKRSFVKNVVAIGLSSGFIEPLESNGLFTVHEWAINLCRLLDRPCINQYDKDAFNYATYDQWVKFAEFVSLHYSMSIRHDTEYWKSNFNRSTLSDEDLQMNGSSSAFISNINQRFSKRHYGPHNSGLNWIATGMRWFFDDSASFKYHDLVDINHNKEIQDNYERIFRILEKRKRKWNNNADKCLDLYDFQREFIHI